MVTTAHSSNDESRRQPAIIAIDWGSSRFRAYLLDHRYQILEKKETMDGMLQTTQHPHAIFSTHCNTWLEQKPNLPVIMSGTVGSNIGWVNTHYVNCPVSIQDLYDEFVRVENVPEIDVKIIPGVTGESLSGAADVMRGEEVQIFGALENAAQENALVCLPGTHSKWVKTTNKKITHLNSFMSGEFYFLARNRSSISSIVDRCEFDHDSFLYGLSTSEKPGGILHHLFSARANSLVHKKEYESISSYISGVIIGTEVMEILKTPACTDNVILVANELLTRSYTIALNRRGIEVTTVSSEKAFITGISLLDPINNQDRI